MVHLTIGHKLLERCHGIENTGAFLLGTISPDAIMFRPGCERADKSRTHFCTGDEGWGYYTNYEDWQISLLESIRKFAGTVDRNFLLGYLSHILADIENSRRFWTPIRLSGDESKIGTFFSDCGEIDSRLLSVLDNAGELWSMLETSNLYCLPEIFTVEDNSVLISKMQSEIYHDRHHDTHYIPSIFTEPAASQFMDDIVQQTMELARVCSR